MTDKEPRDQYWEERWDETNAWVDELFLPEGAEYRPARLADLRGEHHDSEPVQRDEPQAWDDQEAARAAGKILEQQPPEQVPHHDEPDGGQK